MSPPTGLTNEALMKCSSMVQVGLVKPIRAVVEMPPIINISILLFFTTEHSKKPRATALMFFSTKPFFG
jgi:hypothetical protein